MSLLVVAVCCQVASQFSIDHFFDFRGQCKELTRAELDMAILGQLSAFTFSGEQTVNSTTYRHSSDGRQRAYTVFWHGGFRVCRKTFLFLHTISEKRFKNLKASLLLHGLSPRMHGNTKRVPANTISFADKQQVVQFILTYAEAHAILLPGRIPGYKRSDLQLLPSSTTKHNIWLMYCNSLESLPVPHHRVAYSTFCEMWQQMLPHVIVTKPMSDLCWVCQKNSIAIMRAANQPDEQKSEVKHQQSIMYIICIVLLICPHLLSLMCLFLSCSGPQESSGTSHVGNYGEILLSYSM